MISAYVKIKHSYFALLNFISPKLYTLVWKYRTQVKYVMAGGTAAAVDLSLLAFTKEIFGVHYLLAATLAFAVAFFVSFTLQKFWTFGNVDLRSIKKQMVAYFGIAATNLAINAGLMYVLVDQIGLWYFLSQIISGLLIAMGSFILYRKFIFKHRVT